MACPALALEVVQDDSTCLQWGGRVLSQLYCPGQRCYLPGAVACAYSRAGTHVLVSALQGSPTQPFHAVLPALAWDISTSLQRMQGRTALPCCAPSGHALLPPVTLQIGTPMPLSWGMAPFCPSCFISPQLLCLQWCRTISPSCSAAWSAWSGLCFALTSISCMPSVVRDGMCLQL